MLLCKNNNTAAVAEAKQKHRRFDEKTEKRKNLQTQANYSGAHAARKLSFFHFFVEIVDLASGEGGVEQ